MDEKKLIFLALLFIAAVSVVGLVSMMKSSSTGHAAAWGNVYADDSSYRNCYCHNGVYMYAQPTNPYSGIYGSEVRFLGPLTTNECAYECKRLGYSAHYWTNPDSRTPTWPRGSWN